MNVVVDVDRCAGHGNCVQSCPQVFHLTDDGYAHADTRAATDQLRAEVTAAARECPELAITIDDQPPQQEG